MSQQHFIPARDQSQRSPSGHSGVLQRTCACGKSAPASRECEACRAKRVEGLQTKLRIGVPGDAFEQEADRAAEQIMRTPSSSDGGANLRSAPPRVQRRTAGDLGHRFGAPTIVDDVVHSGGQPLPHSTRAFFEPRFGHDFSRVRVHADSSAAASADAVNARAYTVGEHIVFGASQWNPASTSGRTLVAHELAHTIQQGRSPSAPYVARQAKEETSGEELEVLEAPKSADPSEAPWLVFYDRAKKIERKELLPTGTRVEATGRTKFDVRDAGGGKKIRIALRPVRVLRLPGKDPAGVIGQVGSVRAEYLMSVGTRPAPKPKDRSSATKFAERRTAILRGIAQQRAKEAYERQRPAATMGHLKVQPGPLGTVGGALQAASGAIADPIKEELFAVQDALEELQKEITSHPLYAFVDGLVDGIRSTLQPELFANNIETFAKFSVMWTLNPAVQVAFFAGTFIGVKKEIEGLIELVTNFNEVKEQLFELAKVVMSEGGAEVTRQVGRQVGSEAAKRMNEIAGITDVDKLAMALGETFGPMLLEIVIGIATGGSGLLGAAGKRVAELLATKFPKLAAVLDKVRAARKLLPGGKKARPDVPKTKGVPEAPDVPKKAAAPDVPKKTDAPEAPKKTDAPDAEPPKKAPRPLPDAEARELKEFARNRKNIRHVSDEKLLDDGYDVEIAGTNHTYRRRQDGTWCMFSAKSCDHAVDLDPSDAAFINRMARRGRAIATGWAIEDYIHSFRWTRPREFNFPGIDAWRGGTYRGRFVTGADVLQVKGISSLKHRNLYEHYNKGVAGLLKDRWGDTKKFYVVNPKSRSLDMVFDQDTYMKLGQSQTDELHRVMKELTNINQDPPVTLRWYYMGDKGRVEIIP
jgi:hypothetical protein